MRRCAECKKCSYVSVSFQDGDCSWFESCSMSRLQQSGSGHTTLRVRKADASGGLRPEILSWLAEQAANATTHERQPGVGYCSITISAEKNDCVSGELGFWKAEPGATLRTCTRRCRDCARCAYVSFSAAANDCSWYAACDLADLRRPPAAAPDYVSTRVKDAAPPLLAPLAAAHPKLAVATLLLGPTYTCALTQWCERVRVVRAAFRALAGWAVDAVVIADEHADRADCADAIWRAPLEATRDVLRSCAAEGRSALPGWRTLHKWDVVALPYDFVLFADVDVDMAPEESINARTFVPHLVRMLGDGAQAPARAWWQFVANADGGGPVNAGLFLVRPELDLFRGGLRLLQRNFNSSCRGFDPARGWDGVGPARDLGLRWRLVDGADLTDAEVRKGGDGGIVNDPRVKVLREFGGAWTFVGVQIDQGFLFHMFWVRRRSGALFRYGAHKVLHWWGPETHKPWRVGAAEHDRAGTRLPRSTVGVKPQVLADGYTYLSRTRLLGAGNRSASTACAHSMWTVRRMIEGVPEFHQLPATMLGIFIPYFPL
jgi:hypothetical protein